MTEDLRVDTALVRQSGGKLQAIAGLIPEPPATFSPAGADALSTAIAGKVAEVVDPVIAQMPITKDELTRYAQNVLAAADRYDAADHRIAEEILKRLGLFDEPGADGGGSSGGGAGGTAVGTAAPAGSTGSPASGGGQTDQMGQLMQMPMQMAQQAAQIPMQLAGMAAAIPQAMMQGVQSAVQQASQMSEMSGDGEDKLGEEDLERDVHEGRADEAEQRPDEAAPGNSGGERVPEQAPQESRPEVPAAPKPAPTRPADSGSEIAL